MFKPNTTAYFVFQGDFITGRYNGFFCKPRGLVYFPFIPVTYVSTDNTFREYPELNFAIVHIGEHRHWFMPMDLLEEEFSFDKFILVTMVWDGSVSKEQFESIVATL